VDFAQDAEAIVIVFQEAPRLIAEPSKSYETGKALAKKKMWATF